MAKSEQRIQAIKLRRRGMSIKEIAREVVVTPATASRWLRDLELTNEERIHLEQRQIAAGHRGRMIGAEMNRTKRLKNIENARHRAAKEINSLSHNQLFFIGLGLYWGEGAKSPTHSGVTITNSDPNIIKLSIRWFTECLGVENSSLYPRIFISDTHLDRENMLITFWSKTLDIPTTQFRKTIFLNKGKKIYENRDTYYGVMALHVAKSAGIRYKILAYIERVASLT